MYKPSYIVVTSVLVVLAILACARQLLVGLLPPPATNRLEGSRQQFLSAASHYPINWHVVEEEPFHEARKSNKPILLVIGVFGGRVAHELDEAIFGDPDIAQYISQNFYCIRIDGYEHPEWFYALMPVTRLRLELFSGFQAWTLNSTGQVLDFVGHDASSKPIDKNELFKDLIRAKKEFDFPTTRDQGLFAGKDQQQLDHDLLDSQTGSRPSFTAYTNLLTNRSDLEHGGFPVGNIQAIYPNAWRFLSLTGNSKLLKSSLDPLLFSPLLDLQDGGFFRLSDDLNIRKVEFDKGSRPNSEMMLTLAIEGRIEGDQFYQTIAEATFDWLLKTANRTGLVPVCQMDDENPQCRSPRLSFPWWRLRDTLDNADQNWARDYLGLNPIRNPQMVPFVHSRNTLLDINMRYQRVLNVLAQGIDIKPKFNETGYLDVNGHTVARMVEVARIWGDPDRLIKLNPLIDELEEFKNGEDVVHRIDDSRKHRGYLGDYLAYSDARLQQFLATGDVGAFHKGLRVLIRALSLFRGDRPGEFDLSSTVEEMGGIESYRVPQLDDDLSESCTAQCIRLLLAYGRLCSDSTLGKTLLASAKESTDLFANVASLGGASSAGYFCSAAEVNDDVYAISVGPRATDAANVLCHRIPTRFVAPAIGDVRKDLQSRGEGIYLIGKSIQGPYSIEQAAELLPSTLVGRRTQ